VVQGIIKLQFLGPVSFAILILGLLGSAEQAQASAPPVVFWDRGAGTDNWSDPLNWSDNVLPNQKTCEDIFIDVVGDGNVLFDVGSFDVCGSLNIGEGVTLTISSRNTLSNDFGTCTINNDGTIIINGTLFNTGLFNNNGPIKSTTPVRMSTSANKTAPEGAPKLKRTLSEFLKDKSKLRLSVLAIDVPSPVEVSIVIKNGVGPSTSDWQIANMSGNVGW